MKPTIDCRGLSCPQPVLMTLKEIDRLQRGEVSVCVDNDASRENVVRAATAKGWQVKEIVEEKDASYTINLAKT